jgi:hypothetical protein
MRLAYRPFVSRPRLERENPKSNDVQPGEEGEQAPNGMMTCATKQLYHRNEKYKEKNEQ